MSGSGRQALGTVDVALLPVTAPGPLRAGVGALGEDVAEDGAVGLAPGVLPIGHFVGLVGQVSQTKMVVLPNFHAPEA